MAPSTRSHPDCSERWNCGQSFSLRAMRWAYGPSIQAGSSDPSRTRSTPWAAQTASMASSSVVPSRKSRP